MIPAHNEGQVIRRLLEQLITGADPGEMDIIVVANGCADDTAEVAASFGPTVRVLTLPIASKHAASAPVTILGVLSAFRAFMSMRMSSCVYTTSGHWRRRSASRGCWLPRRGAKMS